MAEQRPSPQPADVINALEFAQAVVAGIDPVDWEANPDDLDQSIIRLDRMMTELIQTQVGMEARAEATLRRRGQLRACR